MQKQSIFKRLWPLLGLIIILASCGQKGDLYLPDTTTTPSKGSH
ncbi:LPS translocon maturation chaperone LptM [Candidatus Reidiella endopervernicosa]|nr:lipoprotein [Candidatus Reidiella endopervernicosa]